MAKLGSVVVGIVAVFLGLALGGVGIMIMLEAGSFASGDASRSSGPLGLWGEASESASVSTAPWVGLVLAIVGAAALLFGLRALFVTAEGRGSA